MADRREPNERERELAREWADEWLGECECPGMVTAECDNCVRCADLARALAAYGDERERGGRKAAAEKLADNFARVMHIEHERGFEAGRKAQHRNSIKTACNTIKRTHDSGGNAVDIWDAVHALLDAPPPPAAPEPKR